jgi:hypothetical protein
MQGRYGDDILTALWPLLSIIPATSPARRPASRSDREDIMPHNHRSFSILTLIALALLTACSTDPTRTVATPEFSLASGAFAEAQEVEITCATQGAAIHFTRDGSEPDNTSTLYTAAVTIDTTTTLKARAYRDGWDPSEVALAVYAITDVATPTFDPVTGDYTTVQNVTIACATPDVVLRYTRNGSDPTESDTLYTTPVYIDTTTTLKARAFRTGMTASGVATALYTIDFPDVAEPSFDPAPGLYTSDQFVTLDCATAGAEIRYTLDGSDPAADSTLYTAPFLMSTTTEVRARAFKEFMDPSPVAAGTYTIDYPDVAAPSFDPVPGGYSSDQTVTISCATAEAAIYYTLDNSDPTQASTLYTTSFLVSTPTQVKARAYKTAMDPSPITSGWFVIDYPNVAIPVADLAGGIFVSGVTVSVTCATPGATLHYTTNGATPTESDPVWTTSLTFNTTTTLKVRGFAPAMDPSGVLTQTYAIIPDLVAHYPFSGNADDASGNGHHGTVSGGVTLVNDRLGQASSAYEFDGVDGKITLADESAFDLSQFTLSFRFKIVELPLSEGIYDPGEWYFLSKGTALGNFRVSVQHYGGASYGLITYEHSDSGGYFDTYDFSSSTLVNRNPWYHVVVTVGTQCKIYINGSLVQTTDIPNAPPLTNNSAVLIGTVPDPDIVTGTKTSDFFKGVMDEVRFYSRVLSATEVSLLYSNGG